MDAIISNYLQSFPTLLLVIIIAVTLYTLGKGADILVDEAVKLSIRWGIPKMVIGATIVSLGTTLPEATISVLAALKGNPDLALGNAIGSIIADTGLIIGLAALIGHLPVDRNVVERQGKIQLIAGLLLALVCLPLFSNDGTGNIPQWMGFIFLILLILYILASLRWAKKTKDTDDENENSEENSSLVVTLIKLFVGIFIVIISSKILIPSVEITAIRVGIPQSIIAATLIAFGTSLPELITAITAVRKGHGELAIGNIVGADILNVLFVVGSAAAVTKGGLNVPSNFFKLQIPAMIIILCSFRFFSKSKDQKINKKEGIYLLAIYVIYIVLSYFWM